LSGVLAPGPVTTATIAMGARSRYAGVLIAVGHAIIEFPLMILIMLGMGNLLKSRNAQIAIGMAGGAFLLVMAIQMLISLRATKNSQDKPATDRPILTGVILTATNPYFLLWWASVGLALATNARQLGVWAFALFAIVHWLCDCIWLQALSWASFKGTTLLGRHRQHIVLLVCSLALFVFALMFLYNSTAKLIGLFLNSD